MNTTKIEAQAVGGKKLGSILKELLDIAEVGVSLLTIEDRAAKRIQEAGGSPSFLTVDGYKWATCLCVNDEVVHGIPKVYILKEQDLLTIDIGMLYQGFHTDTAWTKQINNSKVKTQNSNDQFLFVGEKALWEAIAVCRAGNHIGHISDSIQKNIEGAGYSIVKTLVGHGVGTELHEKPQVPGYLKGPIEKTLRLEEGMTLAIEVIYAQGEGSIVYSSNDGWTLATRDHSLSAVFEHTILITNDFPTVLTSM